MRKEIFTKETEVDGQLPFLDVTVQRDQNGGLYTGVYRKQTHTDRLLDFDSNHPTCHHKSVVKSLWTRSERNCSNNETLRKERKHLKEIFGLNGYPTGMI